MSSYTTEVRFLCETAANLQESVGYSDVESILQKSWNKIFDFQFPIFDEKYRQALCTKILKHFYTREIGEETYGLWKLRLNIKMNEIMPYYNQLYKSELIEFNPLYDTDLTTDWVKKFDSKDNTVGVDDKTHTVNSTNAGEGTQTTNTTNDHTAEQTDYDLYSDTPQGALTGVENEEFLTNATKKTSNNSTLDTGDSTGHSTSSNQYDETAKDNTKNTVDRTIANVEDYIQHVMGKSPGSSFSKLIQEFRETFLNIDMLIIDELDILFMGIW